MVWLCKIEETDFLFATHTQKKPKPKPNKTNKKKNPKKKKTNQKNEEGKKIALSLTACFSVQQEGAVPRGAAHNLFLIPRYSHGTRRRLKQ